MNALRTLLVLSAGVSLASCGGGGPIPVPRMETLPELQFTTQVGNEQTLTSVLRNVGDADLNYSLRAQDAPWLTITQGQAGVVAPGQSREIQVKATCEAEGAFTGSLIAEAAGTSPVTVKVALACAPAPDTTPEPLAFEAQQDVEPGSMVTSNALTVRGLNTAAPISVEGGTLIVNGVEYHGTTVRNGDTVAVRVQASAEVGTAKTATVTIGDVKGTFTVTTLAPDTAPEIFVFETQQDVEPGRTVTSNAVTVRGLNAPAPISITGGALIVNGVEFTGTTVRNGDTIAVRVQASTEVGTATIATVTIGGVKGTFTVATAGADTTPEPFSFPPYPWAPLDTEVLSAAITVQGINTAAPISVQGGVLIVNGVEFTGTTVRNGDKVAVRVRTSPLPNTATNASVTIGGVVGPFGVSTMPADTTPLPFSFLEVRDVYPGSTVTSGAITVTGINAPAPISVTGGTLVVNGADFTGTTVKNGDTVAVRVTTPMTSAAVHTAQVTIGGITGTFQATNRVIDLIPDPFTFTRQDTAPYYTLVTSNEITVTGIDVPSPITVTGGSLVINGVDSQATTVVAGDRVAVRLMSPLGRGGLTTARVTIGGLFGDFQVSTSVYAPNPQAVHFPAVQDAEPDSVVTSAEVTLVEMGSPFMPIGGGAYRFYALKGELVVNGVASKEGNVRPGDRVAARLTTGPGSGQYQSASIMIAGMTYGFDVTNRFEGTDTTPDAFPLQSYLNIDPPASSSLSQSFVVRGINTPTPISVTGAPAFLRRGMTLLSNGDLVSNGDTITIDASTSGLTYNESRAYTVRVGGYETGFEITTRKTIQGDYLTYNKQYVAPNGLIVTVQHPRITIADGQITYTISYSLENRMVGSAIPEGSFVAFNTVAGTSNPQSGFFGTIPSGGRVDRTFTLMAPVSSPLTVLSYGADFFAKTPSSTTPNWALPLP